MQSITDPYLFGPYIRPVHKVISGTAWPGLKTIYTVDRNFASVETLYNAVFGMKIFGRKNRVIQEIP